MGHEVEIYTFSLQYPNFLFPGKTQYSDEPAPDDLKINIAVNSINPFNWWKIGREIAVKKPDVVICKFWLPLMGPCFGSIARLVKKNKHTKFISILDNVIPHEKRPGDKAFTSYFVNACDGFIAMSKSVLNDLGKFTGNQNKRFIPHPIYDNFGSLVTKKQARDWLQISEDEKLILFFGIIRKYKGLDLLIEAMADSLIKEKKIKLLVAGEYYDDKTYYEERIKEHGLQEQIIVKGNFIPNEEVKYYFCGADLIVQPYKSATQSGISQMAYHFERPMLVTNVGGLPEIVPDNKVGYVVPVNVKDISRAILRFYDENKEAAFTQNLKTEKKRFEWSNMAKGVLELAKS